MTKIKVLNLYAGIGGNRKLWPNDEIEVTAVEINPEITKIYQDFFPNDKVVVADAHQYLLDNYKDFDFIWSSPPCPTHSNCNNFLNPQGIVRYPDMGLWQEIIFLRHFFRTKKWVVENVKPYYGSILDGQESGRHCFWANFYILKKPHDRTITITNARATTRRTPEEDMKTLQEYHNIDLSNYKVQDKRKLLRNCVNPKLGLHIFNCAFKEKQMVLK